MSEIISHHSLMLTDNGGWHAPYPPALRSGSSRVWRCRVAVVVISSVAGRLAQLYDIVGDWAAAAGCVHNGQIGHPSGIHGCLNVRTCLAEGLLVGHVQFSETEELEGVGGDCYLHQRF